ncbi:helix-turn-helix domain-containing protein [Falsirhodobacter sp. 20TX0035]|uniref:helix-turn-helix domain-containing protein n=1 Tax=Falsirhodobacter sp. 20TX0035 TaxID=3022019 RepID=UPI00232D8D0D|nr:helix-turn-helix domain-containing protein [Falsirhodobacter sp. 20TX0035]MDB6454165.1 helix-turn-helix domain-containing protein [Falsirhodobacter sp. 20TX0035]
MTSPSTDRILDVLEYLMNASQGPVKQVDMARDLGVAPSTLNRIVRILSDRGYLFRTSEKYLIKNFSLERVVPMSADYAEDLQRTLQNLTGRTQAAAEAIVIAGHELLWHSRSVHPNPQVTIWAREGFRRSLFEFDALSRLYLSTLAEDRLDEGFFIGGFFDTSKQAGKRQISWLEANEVADAVRATRGETFACDAEGNHFGIRRFATVVRDSKGMVLHLLSVAESAGLLDVEREAVIRAVLEEERLRLESVLRREAATANLTNMPYLRLVR